MTGILKIVKPGKSINSTDPGDWVFNSSFPVPKFHSDDIRQMTINNGDLTKTVSFAHGLGYVPYVKGYIGDETGVSPLPRRKVISLSGIDEHFWITADATNVYIKYKGIKPWGAEDYYASDMWNTLWNVHNSFRVGRMSNNPFDGAFRFNPLTLSSSNTILSAKLHIGTDDKEGTGTIRFRTWGIDEDNTSSFTDNNPMSRTKTDAFTSNERTVPINIGDTIEVDVKSALEEIKNRSGWSTGNAMGFIVNENNGDPTANMYSRIDENSTYLRLIKNGSTTFSFRVIVFKDKISD